MTRVGKKEKVFLHPHTVSQPSLADPSGGPVDLNCKPQVYSGSGRGGAGSGFDQPLWGISA